MKLRTTLELFAVGGPGSGCDPEVAKQHGHACGRPKGNGSEDTKTPDRQGEEKPLLSTDYVEKRYAEIMRNVKDPSLGTRKNPIYCKGDLEMAAVLIAKGKVVVLDQPDQVSSLINKIKSDAEKMRAQGQKPPNWNLADVSVRGTNLFAKLNKDIPRVEMPQLAGLVIPESKAGKALERKMAQKGKQVDWDRDELDLAPMFIDELKNAGVKVKQVTAQASHLRCTQNELDGAKVGGIAAAMKAGKVKNGMIFITKDNYILDGHHRWAATVINDAADGHMGDLYMPAYKLNIDIGAALDWAKDFQKRWGVAPAGMGHYVAPKKVAASAVPGMRRRWVLRYV